MRGARRNALVAATLSLLVPGAGHLYVGARPRALRLLTVTAMLAAVVVLLVVLRPVDLLAASVGPLLLAALLVANALLLGFRVFAIVDAWRRAAAGAAVALAAIVAAAAVPHVAAAYVAVRGYDVASEVFANDEPTDVLGGRALFVAFPPLGRPPRDLDPPSLRPARAVAGAAPKPFRGEEKPLSDAEQIVESDEPELAEPWVTILLLGSDRGPRQPGHRTDTMIVAAIQRETGRAVLFGVPRNLVGVPLGNGARYDQPLNALLRHRGASALKQSISRLLGVRIDYHALVDLDGFVDLVDALGGVKIHVKERIVDEVTRPAWRETKPRIDVYPGRWYHFSGRTALAYVRSRKASSDYRRMARQRCFLTALADQVDVKSVLLNFGTITGAIRSSLRTDIPLDRVPDLLRLASSVDSRQTLTETFGPAYFAGRRWDRFPYPNVAKIRATVRDGILNPELARERRNVATAAQSC